MHQDWPAPRRQRLPGWVRLALPVAVLTLLIAVVRVLGGFEVQVGRYTEAGPGQPMVLGEILEVTPLRALATSQRSAYLVQVEATCRNLSTTPVPTTNLESAFRIVELNGRTFGDDTAVHGADLNPGLQPRLCQIEASFPLEVSFAGTIALNISPAEYADRSLTHAAGKSWYPSGNGDGVYLLPLNVVPRE